MEKIRMLIEQQQHFLSRHLDNLYQETDPSGTSPVWSNVAIKISQTQTAGIEEGEKTPDTDISMNSAVGTSRDTSGNLDDGSKEGSQQSATEIKLESEPEPVQEPEPEQIPDPEPVPCHEQKPEAEHEGERKVTPEPVPDEIAEQAEEPAEENKATQENDTDASMVQLFSSHSGNTIKGIEMQFTELLTNQLKNINFVKCNQLEDIDSKEMLIVLCIISSRVGTDAAYAIKDINNPANTVLMLIHNKKNHALPKLTSSSVLTDQKFRKLGGVFDLAFFDGRGIYKCEMNDIALKRVCTFIKQNRIDRI